VIDNPEFEAQNLLNLENFMSSTEDQAIPTQHVMQLLLKGNFHEAQEYIEVTMGAQIEALERKLTLLRKEQALLAQLTRLRLHISGETSVTSGEVALTAPAGAAALAAAGLFDVVDSVEDARHAIFATCTELAQQNNGVLLLANAVEEVKKRGIDLKSSRPGTSIGNMLFKSADWTRIGDGLFRWNAYKN